MKTLEQMKAELIAKPDVQAEHDALADEFAIARELTCHRVAPGFAWRCRGASGAVRSKPSTAIP